MSAPIITIEQMRQWEQASWAAGKKEEEVIQRVGAAAARALAGLTRKRARVLILAGKGNNGADARAVAAHLKDRDCRAIEAADPEAALGQLQQELAAGADWIVDGLFGIGLNRPLGAEWQELIRVVNAAKAPVLALDTPSGLHADTGQAMGEAVHAAITLTVGAPKLGLVQPAAWPHTGRLLVVSDIGLVPCPIQSPRQWTLPEDFADFPPARPIWGHKGHFGHAVILAGSAGYHGAAVLAARAAQRARPGLITLFTAPETYVPAAAQLQAVMVRSWPKKPIWPERASAFLCGPGLAAIGPDRPMAEAARKLWMEADAPVVADASALDWLPEGAPRSEALRVITPHPGEAARMLGTSASEVQADREAALRKLSAKFGGCWVVLKGWQTLVGRGTGPVWWNGTGSSDLAQGGSGDVLAGFLVGLLANPIHRQDPAAAIRYAVWEHGAAADRLSRRRPNWAVEDLAGELGRGGGRRPRF